MFMTAAPAAAAMPRGDFGVSLSAATCAGSPRGKAPGEARRIGFTLARLVPDGNVRAMEALATVIVRSDWGQICAAASSGCLGSSAEASEPLVAAAGERIARRALAGTLADASRGANRFHRTGEFPDWARESRPLVQVGNYLFYRL